MLPKIDSPEWSNWGVPQKLDALNEVIQLLINTKEFTDAGSDGTEVKVRGRKKRI